MSSQEPITGYVCSHVVAGTPALTLAVSEPIAPDDTGIEMSCGADHDIVADYKVVRIARFVEADPTIQGLLPDVPPGFVANRTSPAAPWVIERNPSDV